MNKEIYTAIVFIHGREYPIKYRKISNLDRFMVFAKMKYSGLSAVNFYEKESKRFYKQLKP
jgi:hypothetical protein